MNVFVADDSMIVRHEISNMLSEITDIPVNMVGEADEVVSAARLILNLSPDVAILDIQMPNGSGIDVLQEVKSKNPMINIIMLTNFPAIEYRTKCLSLGADYFLDKHTEVEAIPRLLRQLSNKLFLKS